MVRMLTMQEDSHHIAYIVNVSNLCLGLLRLLGPSKLFLHSLIALGL